MTAIDIAPGLKPTICDDCDSKQAEQLRAAAEHARLARWRDLCPPVYQNTHQEDPRLNQKALARVLAWEYGWRGLVIHGKTRRGKTRAAWLLIKRLILEGRSVEAMSAGEFARRCVEAYNQGNDALVGWFEALTQSNVLFIDDFGKTKLTERIESEMFVIFEQRCAYMRPTIFTTNDVGKTLESRMSPDRGVPFVARIREFCEPINF
jgi:DNA replication protein DnaC